jgi:hypothetical protein
LSSSISRAACAQDDPSFIRYARSSGSLSVSANRTHSPARFKHSCGSLIMATSRGDQQEYVTTGAMPNKFELVTKATGLRDRRRCFATASASSGQDPPARRRAGAREWEARAAGAQPRRSARSPFHMHTSDGFAVSSLSSIGRYAAAVVRNWGSTVLRSAGKDAGPMRWDRVAGRCDFYRAPRPCWLQLATGVLHVFHGPAGRGKGWMLAGHRM